MLNIKLSSILMVDDNLQNLQVLGNTLRDHGFIPIAAVNGIEALEFVKRKIPDLILLDIMMPGMDGFEVCKKLKEDPFTQEIPIIFLTALSETESVVKGFELGAVDYITKPFNKKELITRVNTHLELKWAREELKQANATKDKFFSIIAHDLKTPFTALITISELLVQEKISNEEKEEFFRYIQEASKRGFDLLKNLLEWSRSQTKNIDFNPKELNLSFIIEDNIKLLQLSAKAKNIDLSSEIRKDLILNADENMLNTIIRNLISNAIKFTYDGGKVTIVAQKQEDQIEIRVIDSGIGIEPENIQKLFKIDKRFIKFGTKKEKGTGLGLVICKEFIDFHKGSISVESKIGKGSQFIVALPKSLK
ncbi:MAG: hybrid sensor histidine kinase/response regulator [Leptospiraceae bacterium]|nr:hybrid sensor histidine kinase/response regulator [Leptospiraceae bacterium]MCP5497369.1 hybrid sensor histidine kinase/response regulator [Leptospiraceae bacterium]